MPPISSTSTAFHDPTNTSPRPTPEIPSSGLFSIYRSTHISCPPSLVYTTLLDIKNWKVWSTFVYDVTITSHPHPHLPPHELKMVEGTNMTFHVQMSPSFKTTSKETCTHVEPLKSRAEHGGGKAVTRVRWSLHNAAILTPGFVIKSERVNEIEEAEDGGTEYRTWSTFGGLAAKVVRSKYEVDLGDRFEDWCRELKAYCEERHRSDGGAGGSHAVALKTL